MIPNQKIKLPLGTLEFLFSSLPEIVSQSSVQVTNYFLFSDLAVSPCKGGFLDTNMGAIRGKFCLTCGKNWKNCPGHFGFIKLYLPVFNIGYLKALYGILQIVCKGCSKVMIGKGRKKENFLKYLRKTRKKGESSRIQGIMKLIQKCRSLLVCPYCDSKNGLVRKIGICSFIQEFRFPNVQEKKNFQFDTMLNFSNFSSETVLDPLKIFRILQQIDFDDLEFLDMDQIQTRPENLLLSFLPVPPTMVRPSIFIGEKTSNEDDLTIKLCEIQQLNYRLKKVFSQGSSFAILKENWNILQLECARYLNSEIFPKESDSKSIKGLYQRLKGKHGRFRGNLSGKRVDFSGRTVISPDPNIQINKIGFPFWIANRLTFPERVTNMNKKRLERCVLRGAFRYPGANYLINRDHNKITLEDFSKTNYKLGIREGFIVERHLTDNDVILFNRQPSLHRISIMAHRIKIVHGKTFRLNECICKPYNADFDGDEMNVHVPQTQKSRTEAIILMNSVVNFNTPRNGETQIAATQDFLSSAFVLTSKNQFFSCDNIGKILGIFTLKEIKKNIGFPAILKPVILWTGKQLFSLIIFSKFKKNIEEKEKSDPRSLQLKEKHYSLEEDQCSPFICPYDGWVLIRRGELLAGRIGKSSIGSGNKNSILCSILSSESFSSGAKSLLRISRLTSQWFSGYGFSIGVSDISSNEIISKKKRYLLVQGFNLCQIIQLKKSKNQKRQEMGPKKIESKLQKVLGQIREDLGKFCLSIKNQSHNPVSTMVLSGSKGSTLNLIQMVSCLGQQSVEGKRIKKGMMFRVFPHFNTNLLDLNFPTNGFIETGFSQGLNVLNFFFHAIAGREGLIDTAVKTAETGYLQRKLIKSLEDLVTFYDGSVRTSNGRLLQFYFGDDNFDPNNSYFLNGTSYYRFKELTWSLKTLKNSLNQEEMDSFSRGHLFFDTGLIYFSSVIFGNLNLLAFSFQTGSLMDFSCAENNNKNIFTRLNMARGEPGDSVGAIAAQSIGEPGTQMTLQTFHSAGVIDFNITLGIPRINEIMNASKEIKSPLIKANFITMGGKNKIFQTKIKLEKFLLGEVSENIQLVIGKSGIFIDIKFSPEALQILGVSDLSKEICKKIFSLGGFWKNANFLFSKFSGEIRIIPPDMIDEKNFSSIKMMKLVHFCKFDLPGLLIHGFAEPVSLFQEKSRSKTVFFIEGTNLNKILELDHIEFSTIYCNHIRVIFDFFGIEAARKVIVSEIHTIFNLHGISTDLRHLSLLADTMTFQGVILGINRHGLGKLKNNTLVLASFEKTLDNLFASAIRSSRDEILGVSENIILGKDLPVGTGLVTLKSKKN